MNSKAHMRPYLIYSAQHGDSNHRAIPVLKPPGLAAVTEPKWIGGIARNRNQIRVVPSHAGSGHCCWYGFNCNMHNGAVAAGPASGKAATSAVEEKHGAVYLYANQIKP